MTTVQNIEEPKTESILNQN